MCKHHSKIETIKTEIHNKNFQLCESVDESWQAMEISINKSARSTGGVLRPARKDWCVSMPTTTCHCMGQQMKAISTDKKNPSQESKDYLRTAKSIRQRKERRCANKYVLDKSLQRNSRSIRLWRYKNNALSNVNCPRPCYCPAGETKN